MRGDRLKEVREMQGISQTELSSRCQIGMKQIWRYENEESDPTAEQLAKICTALSVSADYLLGLVDSRDKQFNGQDLNEFQLEIIALMRKNTVMDLSNAINMLSQQLSETAKSEYPDTLVKKQGKYVLVHRKKKVEDVEEEEKKSSHESSTS